MIRYKYQIKGTVQGVGFRPFIYKLATRYNLCGFVFNDSSGVTVEIEGKVLDIELFDEALIEEVPVLAHIDNFEKHPIDIQNSTIFEIIQTTNNTQKTTLVPSDTKICDDCLDDINTQDKYKNYFATNCTNCGPRYSIIKTVPYDRVHTSMDQFVMCESCQKEYEDPTNRRYHAQPISCNNCGPKLELSLDGESIDCDDIYKQTANFICEGKIGAIKGIGGFHIVCDSTNDNVIERLRKYKNRPTKPFAIMCKDIEQISSFAKFNEKEKDILLSIESPIVILKKQKNQKVLSELLAPKIDRIGCFLPYTALHNILFKYLDNPILATSANLGGEPIITIKEDILKKLPFIEFVLDFNRDIINAVDDSLVQVINDDLQLFRVARGFTPTVIKLDKKCDKKILAVGANQKNTISFVIEDSLIVSPHIGDLNSLKSFEYFTRTLETFKRFYDFEPDLIVCDKHPVYETTKWAKMQDIPVVQVQHHLSHIYACKAEFGLKDDYLGFSFDGTGYGEDGTLWGGEVFVGDERNYHFKSIKLLGGEKAIKEPRRVALSMLFDKYTLDEVLSLDLPLIKVFKEAEIKILHQSYTKNLNAPQSSSVGRIFDGIASLADILHFQSYEGEAGLMCEEQYNCNITDSFNYTVIESVINIEYDFFDKNIVSKFINTLVKIIIDISQEENLEVILSGGVFQNKTLLELATKALKEKNIGYFYQKNTTINDGGISLGQAYYSVLKED